MQFAGIVETASVTKNHGGGRVVELAPYIAGVKTVMAASADQSLRIDLEPGDVYTTVRRHFQLAAKETGVCLRFRKIVENGTPVALLVAQGVAGAVVEDEG